LVANCNTPYHIYIDINIKSRALLSGRGSNDTVFFFRRKRAALYKWQIFRVYIAYARHTDVLNFSMRIVIICIYERKETVRAKLYSATWCTSGNGAPVMYCFDVVWKTERIYAGCLDAVAVLAHWFPVVIIIPLLGI